MPRDPLLSLDTRRRIVAKVERYPGLHLRELARQLDMSVALVEYHLPALAESGLIQVEADERYQRVYPGEGDGDLDAGQRATLGTLRDRRALQIALYLLDRGGSARHKDLAAELKVSKSLLTFHLKKLQAVGILRKDPDASFALVDARSVGRLLVSHKPTPDLRDDFADLWLSLYES